MSRPFVRLKSVTRRRRRWVVIAALYCAGLAVESIARGRIGYEVGGNLVGAGMAAVLWYYP